MPSPPRLQDMPPRAAALALGVERFIRCELALELRGATVLAGFSGGADSTALLHLLALLAPRQGFRLEAAHLDHGLRPGSSVDADHCATVCARLGIPLHRRRVDVAALADRKRLGLEDAGRQARYGFFQDVLPQGGWLALAHTLDDLAEDQLLRLMRGAGWPELGGMVAQDSGRRLIRPVLPVAKENLKRHLKLVALPWVEDETNLDPAFARNRVRHEILPLFLRENPNYRAAALRLWRLAMLDRRMQASLPQPEAGDDGLLLPMQVLAVLPPALRLRACKAALEALGPGQPRFELLLALERAIADRAVGRVVQFPGGRLARVERSGVLFCRPCQGFLRNRRMMCSG